MIVDGKIKLKNDSQLERFTETGLKFEDGSELSVYCASVVSDECTGAKHSE